MLPDRVSNPGPLTYESGVLPIALRGPANSMCLCYIRWVMQRPFTGPFFPPFVSFISKICRKLCFSS